MIRRDLKFFRFPHRAFYRINILKDEDEDDINFSRSSGTLYQLPRHPGIGEEDAKIYDHTIFNPDVRGFTTVTDEPLKRVLILLFILACASLIQSIRSSKPAVRIMFLLKANQQFSAFRT